MVASRCWFTIILQPAMVPRQRVGSICRMRLLKLMVLSLSTVRSKRCEKIRARQECGATLRSRNLEPAIELDDVMLGKKCVGRFQVSDCAQSQLLGEPSLPGRKASLRASPRLG